MTRASGPSASMSAPRMPTAMPMAPDAGCGLSGSGMAMGTDNGGESNGWDDNLRRKRHVGQV
jgi:hypothetical protein